MKTPIPSDEMQRLEALQQYNILDTPAEEIFEDIALLASRICQTPIALVSFIDAKRQWFKARVGLNIMETSRDISFCTHTILNKNNVMEVPDVDKDLRFAGGSFVKTIEPVRFYAGVPLVDSAGFSLGAMCVMDRVPRVLTPDQLFALRALGQQIIAQLELRRQARELAYETAERQRVEHLLKEQYSKLSAEKKNAMELLMLAQKSRQALLSVLEDEMQAGKNLRESEERFRQLAENCNEVFWMTTPGKNDLLYVSPAYEKIWGRPPESLYLLPQNWLEAVHPEDHDRIQRASLNKDKGGYDEEYRIIRPDKEIRWIHDRAFPIHNPTGEIYRVVGVAEDITVRKKLEEQYWQAQKMDSIGQLAGGVAHDFNNILAIIQMQAGLLKMQGGLTAEQVAFVNEISVTVKRASALTRQLLLFSRREVFRPSNVNLNDTITGVTQMLSRILGEHVQVCKKLAPQPMRIHADTGMIDQVLLNLAVNARDAMPQGGQLVIETSPVVFDEFAASQSPQMRPGSFVCLSISDNGCGIPPTVLPKIFEPFFTTKDVGKGTGLGLSTVFGIVQQHQGWVNVYSEVGQGTTFRIYLPQISQTQDLDTSTSTVKEIVNGDEMILLVEDDPALRSVVRKALSHLGYHILEAPTGIKALEVWKENRQRIELLITDLMMPDGMNGKTLAQNIQQDDPDLKVIYISGYSAEIVGKDLELKEGVNFLTKPFNAKKLSEVVRENLNMRKGKDTN